MRHLQSLLLLLFVLVACMEQKETEQPTPTASVDVVLQGWHKAAATGDFEGYFNYFEDSASIFIGTDATERWTVAQFAPWAKPAFADGKAWDFTAFNRHIYYSDDKTLAWFDEELDTPNLGLCRGTGVLKLVGTEWKIVHYNLAVPVPNEIVNDVRDSILALDSLKTTQ